MDPGVISQFLSDVGGASSFAALLLQIEAYLRSCQERRQRPDSQGIMEWLKNSDAALARRLEGIADSLESINWLLLQSTIRGVDAIVHEVSRSGRTLEEIRDLLQSGSTFPALPELRVWIERGPEVLAREQDGQSYLISLKFVNPSVAHITICDCEVCLVVDGKPSEAGVMEFSLMPNGGSSSEHFHTAKMKKARHPPELCSVKVRVSQDANRTPRVYVPSNKNGDLILRGTGPHVGPRWLFKNYRHGPNRVDATLIHRSESFADYWLVVDSSGEERELPIEAAFTPLGKADDDDRD